MTEHDLQKLCIEWFDLQFSNTDIRIFAIPNGGKRNIVTAKKMKAEGVRSGVLDLFMPVPAGQYHGIFIEMKRPKTSKQKAGTVSKDQKDWIVYLTEQGYCCKVVDDFDQFRSVIKNYLASRN